MTNKESKPKTINTELIYYMFDEIKAELKEMKRDYVTKTEASALKHQIEELQKDVSEFKKASSREIEELKKSKNLWGWLSPTLTAIVTAVFTYLTIEYLKRS